MLYIAGLGLSPSQTGREVLSVVRGADVVYLDTYTNYFTPSMLSSWREVIGDFLEATRSMLEEGAKNIVEEAREKDVVVAVSGDPFVATTHASVYLEALKRGVRVKYLPGVSIVNYALSVFGLQHYKMGRVVTVPNSWRDSPSFYTRLSENVKRGQHTVLLLDLHPRPLSVEEALDALLYWEDQYGEGAVDRGTLIGVVARGGWQDCLLYAGSVEEMYDIEWGSPPYTIVVPGSLHPVEEELLLAVRRYASGRCEGAFGEVP